MGTNHNRHIFLSHREVKWMKLIFSLNILFWSGICLGSFYYHFVAEKGYLIVVILFGVELMVYSLAYLLMMKRRRLGYYTMILMAFGTTLLSVTDEVGIWDILSLTVSLLLFISLIKVWRSYHNYLKI